MAPVLKVIESASDFYLTAKQIEFFDLLLRRPIVNRETAFDHLYGHMPEADQPQDDKVLDQMLVVMRKKCRSEGVNIVTAAEGWTIPKNERVRALKLLEIARAQPKKRTGAERGESRYNEKRIGKREWKIEKGVRRPEHFEHNMKYPWATMQVDDSVLIDDGNQHHIQKSLWSFRTTHRPTWRFSTAKERGGVRVWRDQ